MEHILMLGNGFDLYYKLPTKYSNFLQIVAFLPTIDLEKYETVGSILSAYSATHSDAFVASCYAAHQELYDAAPIPRARIEELQNLTRDNLWFRYLLKSFNKDVGWIDFEKEISTVIGSLRIFIQNIQDHIYRFPLPNTPVDRHIIRSFDYFLEASDHSILVNGILEPALRVKDQYLVEYPSDSGNQVVDQAKIISVISNALYDLSQALKLYLSIFAESILCSPSAHSHFEWVLPFRGITRVITFNYTNTYEQVYYHSAFHLHGSTDGSIVLGINPDQYDEAESADTLCIAFKKYYQRVMYDTDTVYLSWINQEDLAYTLMIMGHSLDVTDADIIKDLFSKATEITILYHDDSAKSSYISNIIKMYGKSGFDRLRKEQKLTFMHINSDFAEIINAREKHPMDRLLHSMDRFLAQMS